MSKGLNYLLVSSKRRRQGERCHSLIGSNLNQNKSTIRQSSLTSIIVSISIIIITTRSIYPPSVVSFSDKAKRLLTFHNRINLKVRFWDKGTTQSGKLKRGNALTPNSRWEIHLDRYNYQTRVKNTKRVWIIPNKNKNTEREWKIPNSSEKYRTRVKNTKCKWKKPNATEKYKT